MQGVRQSDGVVIPEGWQKYSFFGRIVNAGLCSYSDLVGGKIDVKAVFEMHRMLDFQDYCYLKMKEAKK